MLSDILDERNREPITFVGSRSELASYEIAYVSVLLPEDFNSSRETVNSCHAVKLFALSTQPWRQRRT